MNTWQPPIEAMSHLRIDTITVVKKISQISVVNKYSKAPDWVKREKCISLLMLPPVFFSTASRTEGQPGKEKRTLSISQIDHISILSIRLELACNGGQCGGIY